MGADAVTAEAAIYQFLSGFGIPAYPMTSVPDEAEFPYITYDLVVGGWGDGESNMVVNVWYYGDSEAEPNAKVREIAEEIGFGGTLLPFDTGAVWVKRGSPWALSLSIAGEDDKVKRRRLNVTLEYLTTE